MYGQLLFAAYVYYSAGRCEYASLGVVRWRAQTACRVVYY